MRRRHLIGLKGRCELIDILRRGQRASDKRVRSLVMAGAFKGLTVKRNQTDRNEQIRDQPLKLVPGGAVPLLAPPDVPPGAVGDHGGEEGGIEPRKGAAEAGDEGPAHGEPHVGRVVQLAAVAVPAIGEEVIAAGHADDARVGPDAAPGQLGEGGAGGLGAALGGAEAVLLGAARVPDPVGEEVGGEEEGEEGARPAVGQRRVVGQVDGRVAVGQRHAGHVPEDEHEAPLLVEHVPGGGDHLLALAARVGVQEVRHEQEGQLARDEAELLVLAGTGAERDEEEDEPGQAHLEEHLEVEQAEDARVELCAHEEVVDVVAGHAALRAAVEGRGIGGDGDEEAGDDGDGHEGAELVDESVKREELGDVQDDGEHDGEVKGRDAGAVVVQLLAAEVRQGLAFGVHAGQV